LKISKQVALEFTGHEEISSRVTGKRGRPLRHAFGLCAECGIRPKRRKGKYGETRYYARTCNTCHRAKHKRARVLPYRKSVSLTCEACGFQAVVKDQIDVHHRDGNHKNNDPANLASLCANCHRLEHAMERMNGPRLDNARRSQHREGMRVGKITGFDRLQDYADAGYKIVPEKVYASRGRQIPMFTIKDDHEPLPKEPQ